MNSINTAKDLSKFYVHNGLLCFCAEYRIPFCAMKQYMDIHGTSDVDRALKSYRRGIMKARKGKKSVGFYFDGVRYATFKSACESLDIDYEEAMIYKVSYPQLSEKEILSDILGRHSK